LCRERQRLRESGDVRIVSVPPRRADTPTGDDLTPQLARAGDTHRPKTEAVDFHVITDTK